MMLDLHKDAFKNHTVAGIHFHGSYFGDDLMFLSGLVQEVCTWPHAAIAELGVQYGLSLSVIAESALEDWDIYGYDIWPDDPDVPILLARKMELLFSDRVKLTKMPAAEAGKAYNGKPICFLHVDMSKDTKEVVDAVGAWLPHMPGGSIIAGHDYAHHRPKIHKQFQVIRDAVHTIRDSGKTKDLRFSERGVVWVMTVV